MIVDTALTERHAAGRPVRVGLIGAGFMGRSMTRQMMQFTHGMKVVAVANRTIERAERCFADAGHILQMKLDQFAESCNWTAALADGPLATID